MPFRDNGHILFMSFLTGKIAIVAITYYDLKTPTSVLRAGLTKEMVKNACSLGYLVVLVDGGSPRELIKEYQNLGAIVHKQKTKSMGAGRREAIEYANSLDSEIVFLTEPEKASLVSRIEEVVGPILEGKADIVMPWRRSLGSYPIAQQLSERFGNLYWKEMTGLELDVFFGPRVWHKDISKYFLEYDGAYGDLWDSLQVPVINAISDGKRVISVPVEYRHPVEQTKTEERDLSFFRKRIEQLINCIDAFEKAWLAKDGVKNLRTL